MSGTVQPLTPGRAFGVDPFRRERYSLRQSRYDALASDLERLAAAAARAGRDLSVLEIGCSGGSLLRHLEVRPHAARILLSGTNVDAEEIYRRERYRDLFVGDLMRGYPQIPSGSFDVVVCEQVLEHLSRLEVAIKTIGRLVRPGGHAIVGVPIFVPPVHLVRRHLVPWLDRALGRRTARSHLQSFSLGSFLADLRRHSDLELESVRGLRVVSGGLLRGLENHRWWWQLNRQLGAALPAICIEAQAILRKPHRPGSGPADSEARQPPARSAAVASTSAVPAAVSTTL